tara:strand:- start:791 stop:2164 length:1374 start_codon:yes stop_codon:yes gene_type:complete
MNKTLSLPYPASSFELFGKLRSLALPVLLHSGKAETNLNSRYDILVADPSTVFRYQQGTLLVEHDDSTQGIKTANPILSLAEFFPINNSPAEQETETDRLPFCGGFVGYFAYDILQESFGIAVKKSAELTLPSVLAGIYDWAVIVDHQQFTCTLAAQASVSSTRLKQIETLLNDETKAQADNFTLGSAFQSNFSRQAYQNAFEKIMSYIYAGDCYQVNLSQCFQASCEGDPYEFFARMQAIAAAPFAAYMEDKQQALMCFSPERFLRVKNKQVITQPIKGTRARHKNKQADKAALTDLCNSTKDKAENLMIVDLLRNDLGKVCRTGSVQVESLFEAHSFTNVHHLISTISGELKQASDVFSLLNACFPGGSITGTPKLRAMQIIDEVESMPRSVYCGSIVWIDQAGNMDSNIAIRTLLRDRERLYCWGGGAIVADSDMQLEYQESLDKIALFMDALS